MIEYKQLDITTVNIGIIAHQVNCQGVMGSGVAYAIRKKHPDVYIKYLEFCKRNGPPKRLLGRSQIVQLGHNLCCANIFGQLNYGMDTQHTNIQALSKGLREVYMYADVFNLDVFLPKIGCGLGGADWARDVEPIIAQLDKHFESVNTFVCVWGE